jgi:hypothetical protein
VLLCVHLRFHGRTSERNVEIYVPIAKGQLRFNDFTHTSEHRPALKAAAKLFNRLNLPFGYRFD